MRPRVYPHHPDSTPTSRYERPTIQVAVHKPSGTVIPLEKIDTASSRRVSEEVARDCENFRALVRAVQNRIPLTAEQIEQGLDTGVIVITSMDKETYERDQLSPEDFADCARGGK